MTYDINKPLVLSADASPSGVSAVVSHSMDNGSERPIMFALRTLNQAKQNYAQLDRKGLAVIFRVKRFHQYIFGHNVEIHTNQKQLIGLLRRDRPHLQMASSRVIRWGVLIADRYSYSLRYKPRRSQDNCDGLRRLPLSERPGQTPSLPDTEMIMHMVDT